MFTNYATPFPFKSFKRNDLKHEDIDFCNLCREIVLPDSYLNGWCFCPINKKMVWHNYNWALECKYEIRSMALNIIQIYIDNYRYERVKETKEELIEKLKLIEEWRASVD